LPPVLPLKDSARARIQELVRVLEPHFPEITTAWRARMFEELDLDGRAMAALERLNLGTGFGLCCKTDFSQFADNLRYYGTRLAKLNVDTRVVARALELYQSLCEPYLAALSPMARAEAISALETFNSTTFVSIAGTYFDTNEMLRLLCYPRWKQNSPRRTSPPYWGAYCRSRKTPLMLPWGSFCCGSQAAIRFVLRQRLASMSPLILNS